MRQWLRDVGEAHQIPVSISDIYYPFSEFTDWHARAENDQGDLMSCTLLGGHIRIPPISERRDERQLGRVVTTTRNAFNTFASKYFHRMRRDMEDDIAIVGNENSRRLFFYFNDLDPCELLQYYDGVLGCPLHTIESRIATIADRIDCVIDSDDPDEDISKLCEMMGVKKKCPPFPYKNSNGKERYRQLQESEHITVAMERVVKVGRKLREALMEKRCRFLDENDIVEGGWPKQGCLDHTEQ